MNKTTTVPGCTKTKVRKILKAYGLQFLEVVIGPNGNVPRHNHGCPATMIITAGSARKLDGTNKRGKVVKPGDVVHKRAREIHGFKAGPRGLKFISVSGGKGIVHGKNFDMKFRAAFA